MRKTVAFLLLFLFVFASVFANDIEVEQSDTETILDEEVSEPEVETEPGSRPKVALVLSG